MCAIDSMRLEKGCGHWKSDFITEFNPIEAGLHRFVDITKAFTGKPGLESQTDAGSRKERVMLEIQSDKGPAQPGEGVFVAGASIGVITSAAWGYRTGTNLAMAYVDPSCAEPGTEVEVLLIGDTTRATVRSLCVFDPENTLPRGVG